MHVDNQFRCSRNTANRERATTTMIAPLSWPSSGQGFNSPLLYGIQNSNVPLFASLTVIQVEDDATVVEDDGMRIEQKTTTTTQEENEEKKQRVPFNTISGYINRGRILGPQARTGGRRLL